MNRVIIGLLFFCTLLFLSPLTVWAEKPPHPSTYIPSILEIEKHKQFYDDPRPFFETLGPRKVLPPDLYAKLAYDPEKMKTLWAGLVGFRAPDVVGRIAPEIGPGKYSHKEKDKHPGLKKLMWPQLYQRITQGGPPHAGCIPEFEVVPTRQYYWALPVAAATRENLGKTKQDENGYIITETWEGGYPFPRPSGPYKAQQIMYNVEKRYLSWGSNFYLWGRNRGFSKSLRMDFDGSWEVSQARCAGRVLMEPLGWFDGRAQKRGESKCFIMGFIGPRDIAGTAQSGLYYLDVNKADQLMMYIPSLRRIRKMSATDSQDPVMGQDQIYDDNEGWMQKLSPTRYPYKFEVKAEREFLVPAPSWDGAEYIRSGTLELKNMKFERRPLYVVELTQLDPNYVYSRRVFYIDKETFNYLHVENFDQKGRLYRSWDCNYSFFPEMGMFSWCGAFVISRDHLDLHSSIGQPYQVPAAFTRKDVGLSGLVNKSK